MRVKERNSNIELLRIVAGFMILAGHFIKQARGNTSLYVIHLL